MVAPQLEIGVAPIAVPVPGGPIAEWSTNDGVSLRGYRADGYGWISAPGLAVYRFAGSGPALAVPEDRDEGRIKAVWLSSVLPLVIQAQGTQVLHASSVAGRPGVVALCGPSGSGKSTLAVALSQRGYEQLADDALPFRVEGDRVVVLPIPFVSRLRPAGRALLDLNVPSLRRPASEPRPLRAMIVIQANDDVLGQVKLEPIDAALAAATLGELLPHLYCFALDESKETLVREVSALIRAVPVRRLAYPHTPESIGTACDLVAGLLDG